MKNTKVNWILGWFALLVLPLILQSLRQRLGAHRRHRTALHVLLAWA